jgi:hypothetical protein
MSFNFRSFRTVALAAAFSVAAAAAQAGPIFLTGHDPDFHAQSSVGAQNLLRTGLNFVTNNTVGTGLKFLWVESFLNPTSGHLVGENGLNAIGLTEGVEYDWVDAGGFATANLSNYDAIAVASSFGGMLTQAELDALIARKTEIATFVNAGRGVMALAECHPASSFCQADTLGPAPATFGFLPVVVSSVPTINSYFVTPFGASLGLTNGDVNDPTHNSFGLFGGLNVVDVDAGETPTTLAGNVRIVDTGFVPEPSSIALLGGGLAVLAAQLRRRRGQNR